MNPTDFQKAHVIQQMIKANPMRSATSIINQLKGTKYSIRKKHGLEVIKNLKRTTSEVEAFAARNENSNMLPGTRKRVEKEAMRHARKESVVGTRKYAERNPGKTTESVQDFWDTFYNRPDRQGDAYVDFYADTVRDEI